MNKTPNSSYAHPPLSVESFESRGPESGGCV
jgi:hypothetical protein